MFNFSSKFVIYNFIFQNCRTLTFWSKTVTNLIQRFNVRPVSTFDNEEILGRRNRERCVEKLRAWKTAILTEDDVTRSTKAAVLVPLCRVSGELSLLYTVRGARLRRNAGHVSFPGGLQDEADPCLRETALRETHEELGIEAAAVDVWGHGPFLLTADQAVIVRPYLGYVGTLDVGRLVVNHAEVAQVFTVPLRLLCDPACFSYTQFRQNYVLPAYTCVGHRIWGLTAFITHTVLASLLPHDYHNKLKFIKPIKVPRAK